MIEIESSRLNDLVDPTLTIWSWEVPLYLFLGGIAAGLMILSALLDQRLAPAARSPAGRLWPFAGPLLLGVGMLALFLDLTRRAHVHRFYLAFRPSSPMSWGAWLLVAAIPAVILLGLSGLPAERAARGGRLVRAARALAVRHASAVRGGAIVCGLGLGLYTGLLLGTLAARPLWSSALLGPLFLASGITGGAALMMLFRLSDEERALLGRYDLVAIAVELGLLALLLLELGTGSAASRQAAGLLLGGQYTAPFFALVVVGGLLVPLLCETLERRRALGPTLLVPLLLLAGGLSLRTIFVAAGQR